MKKLIAIVGILLLAFWTTGKIRYALGARPVDADDQSRISVTIPSGSSAADIAALLEEKDVIRSAWAFQKAAKKADKAASLQAGTFVLQKSMSAAEIVEALSRGQTAEMSLTIPEGFTVKDIDALLVEKGLITEGDLVACAQTCDFSSFDFIRDDADLAPRGGKLEGYLYPDTYFVSTTEFVPKFFLERLLGTFETKVIEEHAAAIRASGRSLHEIVTMSSLVEEETRTADERPMVAGILWKRFDEGIGLYVDASNRYILNKPTATITAADLDMDSPYNLRKYRGLPPGPIANPGLRSIEAALEPESSPYYYYLHGSDGMIRYAVTNEEHNVNRARYLR